MNFYHTLPTGNLACTGTYIDELFLSNFDFETNSNGNNPLYSMLSATGIFASLSCASCLLYLTNPLLPCSLFHSRARFPCIVFPVSACIAATVFASRVLVLRCSGVSVPVSFLFRCVGPVSVYRACLPVVSFSCAVARRPPWGPCVMSHTTVWSYLVLGLVAEPMAYLYHTCLRVTFDVFVFFLHCCCTLCVIMSWTNIIVFVLWPSLSPSPVPRNHLGSPTSPVCIAPYRWSQWLPSDIDNLITAVEQSWISIP
ncbi:hypothetical protein ARMGADRAFT_483997 [Armillaria gallica]|uniref:Uncharacterized protein n=1 Tax=Armillaria gallica TaxID=47427 RepID=A0A2H3DUN9_ARMGA|nr:hypothetical protein ARMGADRAFT_483997 [Armillaria gallica]